MSETFPPANQDPRPIPPAQTPQPAAPPPQGPPAQPQAVAVQQVVRTKTPLGVKILIFILVSALSLSVIMNVSALATNLAADGTAQLATHIIQPGNKAQTVAVYDVVNVIDGKAVAQFKKFHDSVLADKNVRAVVLRIESPGGGLTASDQIHNMVLNLKDDGRRIVISMGALAASGGYYISAPADEILAEKTTMTGSIGVIATWLVLEGTMDKLGIEPMVVKSSHATTWKDQLSPFRTPAPYEMAHLTKILDDAQLQFEQVVSDGRGDRLKPREETVDVPDGAGQSVSRTITEPFNGKIYGASEALELGLIDSIGYEEDAIQQAISLAALSDARVVRYQPHRGLLETLMQGNAKAPVLGIDAEMLEKLQTPRIELIWRMQ